VCFVLAQTAYALEVVLVILATAFADWHAVVYLGGHGDQALA
jgi:hypothetical protein